MKTARVNGGLLLFFQLQPLPTLVNNVAFIRKNTWQLYIIKFRGQLKVMIYFFKPSLELIEFVLQCTSRLDD